MYFRFFIIINIHSISNTSFFEYGTFGVDRSYVCIIVEVPLSIVCSGKCGDENAPLSGRRGFELCNKITTNRQISMNILTEVAPDMGVHGSQTVF